MENFRIGTYIAKVEEVNEIADQIISNFNNPFTIGIEEYFTSPSIDISLYPDDGQNVSSLVKHADTAMYLAKKRGKDNYQYYVHEGKDILDRRMKIERGLKSC